VKARLSSWLARCKLRETELEATDTTALYNTEKLRTSKEGKVSKSFVNSENYNLEVK
jgi:hypothetical protein